MFVDDDLRLFRSYAKKFARSRDPCSVLTRSYWEDGVVEVLDEEERFDCPSRRRVDASPPVLV